MRASIRWTAGAFACVMLLAGLAAFGPRLWLRTGHGHRTVERLLDRILNERVPGSVTVGRLHGNVWTGLAADDVVVRNPSGAIIGHAPKLRARWRPWALVRHRTLDEVQAERPVLVLERARWQPPPGPRKAGPPRETTVALIAARDGQVSWKGTTFTRVTGTAALHSLSHLDVHDIIGRVAGNTLYAFGVVGWGHRPAWVAARFSMDRPARLHGRGEVFYTRGQLDGEIDELTVAAPVATGLVGGRGALRVEGRVQGGEGNISSDVRAKQDRRALRLRVSIDPHRGEAQIGARLAGVPRPIQLRARARYRPGILEVSSLHAAVGGSRVDGSGTLALPRVRAALRLRLSASEARLLGLKTAAPIDAQVRADGPLHALAVQGRMQLEAARLALRGRVDAPARSGRLQLTAHAVQLARVWRGGPAVTVSGRFALAGRLVRQRFVGAVHVAGGDVVVSGRRVSALESDAQVELGRQGRVSIRRLAGQWNNRHLAARGELGWTHRRITFTGADVDFDGTHARAQGHYNLDDHRLSLRADPVSFSPALLARLLRGPPPPHAWTARVALEGTRDDMWLASAGATHLGALRTAAHIVRKGAQVDFPRVEVRLGDSYLVGGARYRSGHLDASVRDLMLSQALLSRLSPSLQPTWPIHVRGAVTGPLQALALTLAVDAGPSNARLSGRIVARRFQLWGHLDNFELSALHTAKRRVRVTLELAASGRFDRGGAVGTLSIRNARGYIVDSPFYRGKADARLEGRGFTLTRAVAEIPGAKLVGNGNGALGQEVKIDFGVVITNALELRKVPDWMRIPIGINSILPGRSVSGSIIKRPGQKVEITHHVLPIGVSQIAFLWRVITGRQPRFQQRP